MRRLLAIPGFILAFGSSAFFVLGCLGWLNAKFGFVGVIGGLLLAPVTAFVVPVWKGVASGNWWLLVFFPLFWGGSICFSVGSRDPVTRGRP